MRLRHVLIFLVIYIFILFLFGAPRELIQINISSKYVFIGLFFLMGCFTVLLIYNIILDLYYQKIYLILKYIGLIILIVLTYHYSRLFVVELREHNNFNDRENTEIYESRNKY